MMEKQYASEKVDIMFRAKLRLGIWLLLCFVTVYSVFVALHVFKPDWLALTVAGVSLGLVLGASLIVSTAIMALVFHLLSCRIERSFADQLQHSLVMEKK